MKTYQQYINGAWVAPLNGKYTEVYNPSDDSVVGMVANGNDSSLLRSAEYMVSFMFIPVDLSPAFPYEEVLSQPQSYQPVSICADSVSDKP